MVAKLLEGTCLSTLGGQDTLIGVVTFTSWLEAYSTENQPLADFYPSRFREEFKQAFEAWVSLDPANKPEAPSSPFAMADCAPARTQGAADTARWHGVNEHVLVSEYANSIRFFHNFIAGAEEI